MYSGELFDWLRGTLLFDPLLSRANVTCMCSTFSLYCPAIAISPSPAQALVDYSKPHWPRNHRHSTNALGIQIIDTNTAESPAATVTLLPAVYTIIEAEERLSHLTL